VGPNNPAPLTQAGPAPQPRGMSGMDGRLSVGLARQIGRAPWKVTVHQGTGGYEPRRLADQRHRPPLCPMIRIAATEDVPRLPTRG
jgi:hypothetical protein